MWGIDESGINKKKRQPIGWEKILVIHISNKGQNPKYIKNSHNSIGKTK